MEFPHPFQHLAPPNIMLSTLVQSLPLSSPRSQAISSPKCHIAKPTCFRLPQLSRSQPFPLRFTTSLQIQHCFPLGAVKPLLKIAQLTQSNVSSSPDSYAYASTHLGAVNHAPPRVYTRRAPPRAARAAPPPRFCSFNGLASIRAAALVGGGGAFGDIRTTRGGGGVIYPQCVRFLTGGGGHKKKASEHTPVESQSKAKGHGIGAVFCLPGATGLRRRLGSRSGGPWLSVSPAGPQGGALVCGN
jgi:hypothetical protein